jgi:hypothetical protein
VTRNSLDRTIRFTRYLDRQSQVQQLQWPCDHELAEKANAVVRAGGRFELEGHPADGEMYATCAWREEGGAWHDHIVELCEHENMVDVAIRRVVELAYQQLVERSPG